MACINLESGLKCAFISYAFLLEGCIPIVVSILFGLFKMDHAVKLVLYLYIFGVIKSKRLGLVWDYG